MKLLLALLPLILSQSALAQKKAKKAEAKAESINYTIDVSKSEIGWLGKRTIMPSKHNGTIKLSSGAVTMKGDELVSGKFEVDMNSIANEDLKNDAEKMPKLIGHLKSDDFFNVEKFPKATFVLKSGKPSTTGGTHMITGDLTIRDKTNTISFPATIKKEGDMVMAKAEFKVDRTLFDVKYGSDKFFKSIGDKVISNDIDFTLNLTAKKP